MIEQSIVDLSRDVGAQLRDAGWRVATAESCSGGLVGHLLTEIAGSSAYFQGGIIAYENAVKRGLLGVRAETLEQYGAVSEACALEMAAGARQAVGTEVAVATTGIAGPGGGSAEKPVGLVYIAVATPHGSRCERQLFAGDRSTIKQETARRALELVREMLGPAADASYHI